MDDELDQIIPSIMPRVLFEGALRRSLPTHRQEIIHYIKAFLQTYVRYCPQPLDVPALYRFMIESRTCCEFQAGWIRQKLVSLSGG